MESIKFFAVLVTAFFYLLYSPTTNAKIMCAQRDGHLMLNAAAVMNNTSNNDMAKILTATYYNRTGIMSIESCEKYCYAAWLEEKTKEGPAMRFFIQGCWLNEGRSNYLNCKSNTCIGVYTWNLKQCCCNETNCNINVTDPMENKMIIPSTLSKVDVIFMSLDTLPDRDKLDIIIPVALSLALILIFLVTLFVIRMCKKKTTMKSDEENSEEELNARINMYSFDNMKFSEVVGKGKYGSVYLATVGNEKIAVKIFPAENEEYFKCERETYRLPFMEHPSLLEYLGWNERYNLDGKLEYLLMMSYAPGGTLFDFLIANTLEWSIFIKMALSIVKGLSYLHMDKRIGDKVKPAIVHRDLNSQNILIKADGSCCICNFGHALWVAGSKIYLPGETEPIMFNEIKIVDVEGHLSIQYMAPEVLEGHLNIANGETALKQVDVYALGIVLWELLSRCIDTYALGTEVPPYKPPFGNELDYNFTLEKMLDLVVEDKARPLFEGILSEKPGVKIVKDTIEDCWDFDPEARLTSLCVKERMTVLQKHREVRNFFEAGPSRQYDESMPSTSNNLRGEQKIDEVALVEPGLVVRYKGVHTTV